MRDPAPQTPDRRDVVLDRPGPSSPWLRNPRFTEEGTLRSQELTESGERRDMALYALLSTD
ncbi:MAG: hypothetical protein H0V68_05745 [Actinobacteria bacterium]|nr:hypothetical protein [Actinomycetota bacterium]